MNASAETVRSGLSLRANFSWTFAGNVVYTGCQWLMLMVLAQLGSPAMVGQFALGLAVTAPIMMFTNLQLRAVQATDARQEYRFGDYFALRLISTLLALLIIVTMVLFAGYRRETALVILTVGVAKAFEAVSDVFYGLQQQHERMDRIAQSMMIKGVLSLLAFGVAIAITGRVLWGTLGLAAVWAVILVAYDVRSGRLIIQNDAGLGNTSLHDHSRQPGLAPCWQWRPLVKLVWLAWPLGLVMMLLSLNANIPRYMSERYLGERELGIFAALAYLMIAGNTVIAALGQSATPRLARYYAQGDRAAFGNLLLRLMGIGVIAGAAGVVGALIAGQPLLGLIYGTEYADHSDVLLYLMIAAGIGYVASFLGYGMTAARYFRIQMPLFALIAGCTTIACMKFIPAAGLRGAALALIISIGIQVCMSGLIMLYALYKPPGDQQTMTKVIGKEHNSLRILHVVGGMARGGVETWLRHVLHHVDRTQLQMDFLVHTTQACAYDDEILTRGSAILPCMHPSQPWHYARNFRRIIRDYGPYDIVHSHVHHYSGYVLALAKQAGVPVRIAHSHNDTSEVESKVGLMRQGYLALMRYSITQYATAGLSASRKSAAALFGDNWQSDPRWQLLYYGIDLQPFRIKPVTDEIRAELNIPADAFVIGHVGRFDVQKNHAFLVDIVAEVVRHKPETHLLLVGEGALRPAIERKVARAGLCNYVTFAGLRTDVPRLMMGAMDVFVLPSFYEGLPLVLIEAQAAGLPCIFTDALAEEADIVDPLIQRLSLDQSATDWSEAILGVQHKLISLQQGIALSTIEQSQFNICNGVYYLQDVYRANITHAQSSESVECSSSASTS